MAEDRGSGCWSYILRCADGTLYTGWTNDLERRVCAHNAGRGSKYTRARRPVELAYCERHADKRAAMRREWEIKQLSRGEKLRLCARKDKGEDGQSAE